MKLLKQLVKEEEGQGMTEYALILGLVVLGFWILVKNSGLGDSINNLFVKAKNTVDTCC